MLELRSKEKKRTMLALCKITKNNKASNEIITTNNSTTNTSTNRSGIISYSYRSVQWWHYSIVHSILSIP